MKSILFYLFYGNNSNLTVNLALSSILCFLWIVSNNYLIILEYKNLKVCKSVQFFFNKKYIGFVEEAYLVIILG